MDPLKDDPYDNWSKDQARGPDPTPGSDGRVQRATERIKISRLSFTGSKGLTGDSQLTAKVTISLLVAAAAHVYFNNGHDSSQPLPTREESGGPIRRRVYLES